MKIFCILSVAAFALCAHAYTLSGSVSDESGSAIANASVSLLGKGLSTQTDANGKFSLHEDEPDTGSTGILQQSAAPGYISVNGGVLSYSQSVGEPVKLQIFDLMGNRLFNGTLKGSGSVDLQQSLQGQGTYLARVQVGSAQQSFRFTSKGRVRANVGSAGTSSAKVLLKAGDSDNLKVIAEGYDTLMVALSNLDTALSLTLVKAKEKYAFGYALKNDPYPTRGCGKDLSLPKTGSFDFSWSGGTRTVRIDIPDNYDNSKPYRLVFGMHCMGGWAGGVQQEGYYGLKPLDTEYTTIFVAPEGNGNTAPWAEADYTLFDELLDKLESELCIDSSRVFSTGFSYGSMFTNGLSWNHQKVLRGVAVYETAERNIWLPTRTGEPIAWMGVHAMGDPLCTIEMGRAARDSILMHNGIDGADARGEAAEEYPGSGAHLCYNYKTVDPRFPVRWCTTAGSHIWNHTDPNASSTWVPEATWDFITQF